MVEVAGTTSNVPLILVRAERRKMGLAAELRQGAGVDPRIDARRKARPRAPAPMVHPNDNDGCCCLEISVEEERRWNVVLSEPLPHQRLQWLIT